MSIQPLAEGHATALLRLYDALDDAPPVEHTDAQQRLVAYLSRLATWPGSGIWGWFVDANLLGSYSLIVVPLLVHGGRQIGLVESVVVDASARGQGIGAALMQDAAERGRSAGCYKLMLSSNLRRRQAHDFYQHLGFQPHGYSYHLDIDQVGA